MNLREATKYKTQLSPEKNLKRISLNPDRYRLAVNTTASRYNRIYRLIRPVDLTACNPDDSPVVRVALSIDSNPGLDCPAR